MCWIRVRFPFQCQDSFKLDCSLWETTSQSNDPNVFDSVIKTNASAVLQYSLLSQLSAVLLGDPRSWSSLPEGLWAHSSSCCTSQSCGFMQTKPLWFLSWGFELEQLGHVCVCVPFCQLHSAGRNLLQKGRGRYLREVMLWIASARFAWTCRGFFL